MLKSIVIGIHLLISLLLIAAVLLQSGRSAGLSGAIAGGAELFLGKKKGLDEWFAKVTVMLAVAFGLMSLILVVWK